MLQDVEIADFSDFVSIDDNDLKNVLGLERDNDGNIYDPLAQDLDNDGVYIFMIRWLRIWIMMAYMIDTIMILGIAIILKQLTM